MQIHLVGGFLGSGKTTAIISAAKTLIGQGQRVGVITNDQGKYLVDTHFMRLQKIPTVEVNGGCFCCNYHDFADRLEQIVQEIQADVIFAESVGSCADMVATVMQPLLSFKETASFQASLSVFTDARLLKAYLTGQELPFHDGVRYIFEKQIEEAGLIIINKQDLLSPSDLKQLMAKAKENFPHKIFLAQNSLQPAGVRVWLTGLEQKAPLPEKPLSIVYPLYGAGEQQLAWFDGQYQITEPGQRINEWLEAFLQTIVREIHQRGIAVGHFKCLIEDQNHFKEYSLVAGEEELELTGLHAQVWRTPLRLIINARLECNADLAQQLIEKCRVQASQRLNMRIGNIIEKSFHPNYPTPTHHFILTPTQSYPE